MDAPPTTPRFDRDRRANEDQRPPVTHDTPRDQPWVGEGRTAFESRAMFQPSGADR